ncbi:MAG: hypothetical protein ACI92E_003206 [Oceanicoccus sp.]|jgi:hypothetical protein
MTKTLHADYLVVGGGAMGMAFTDTIMTESGSTVIMVDKYHQPGGHWNVAYPYVRLHQPSAFYGVNSRKLGSDTVDASGWNKGLYELATNSEVCAYFDQVMQQQLLPTGRMQYFPMCEYQGGKKFRSIVSGEEFEVVVKKVVDATFMNVTVPSMTKPVYKVAEGVECVPPNYLPRISSEYNRYVVVGAGKTGMDACLFLLKNGVSPDVISWVMPRDSWMLDRANIQPAGLFSESLVQGFTKQMAAIAAADSVEDLFERVNACGQLLRFDESVVPTMYRCATVTKAELEQLRRIKDVIRLGHVQSIDTNAMVLDQGEVKAVESSLYIDCTADGLQRRSPEPVFSENKITLQSVRTCQQVFSAAYIGHIEASYDNDGVKNELSVPVPHPDSHIDFLRTTLANSLNSARWSQEKDLQEWLKDARLDGFSQVAADGSSMDSQVTEDVLLTAMAGVQNLQKLLAEVDENQ